MDDLPTLPSDQLARARAREAEDSPPSSAIPVSTADLMSEAPPAVSGYTLIQPLGAGGMGVVWEAFEHRFERSVALKVQRFGTGLTSDTFVEAKLAARIAHPGIVPVHDVGQTADGRTYYTMDLVEGTELRAELQDGPLAIPRALSVAADVADAIDAAHRKGIVHCDLKPGNVMIDSDGRVRVLDFGLAGALVGADRGVMSAGTPPYMSPEQVAGLPVGRPTDIYALGVVLYQMLTGELPLLAETLDDLIDLIIAEVPQPPSARRPGITEDVDKIVLKCLEKDAEVRFSSARALAHALRAVREGRPLATGEADVGYVPIRPTEIEEDPRVAARNAAALHWEFRFPCRSTPDQLWPLVANTERFNKAANLPAVQFETSPDPAGGAKQVGRFRRLGLEVAWDEHPFEWVLGREHSVYREHTSGPLRALWNRVRLEPNATDGTDVVHEVWVEPRHLLGRIAAQFDVKFTTGPGFARTYRQIDEFIQKGAEQIDPFEAAHRPTPEQRHHIEAGISRLQKRGFAEGLITPLAHLLLTAPAKQLEKLRPYLLAERWGTDRDSTLDLFIYASEASLVDLSWDLVCTSCRVAHNYASKLCTVEQKGFCVACHRSVTHDLAHSVEMTFRPNRAVREVPRQTYCIGSPALRPHILAQQVLRPGEVRPVDLDLPVGQVSIVGPRMAGSCDLAVSAAGFAEVADIDIKPDGVSARPAVLRAGAGTLVLRNHTEVDQIVRIERAGLPPDAVTACEALTRAALHEVYPDAAVGMGEPLEASTMSFLSVALPPLSESVITHGDAKALTLLLELEERVRTIAREHLGLEVEGGEGLLLGFAQPRNALRAAIKLFTELPSNVAQRMRCGIHSGRCIVEQRDRGVRYFGETVIRTDLLAAEAHDGAVAISADVADLWEVAPVMADLDWTKRATTTQFEPFAGRRIIQLSPARVG